MAKNDYSTTTDRFSPYVTSVAANWQSDARWRPIDGSLLFVDISGFTNLSERLARRGRIGAEELTSVLDRIFGRMLEVSSDRGGSLIKFGGDALLLLFDSEDHALQACAAAVEMRAALREAAKEKTSVGRINLKMSSGVHTGTVDFFLVGSSHRELIVTGPTATVTTQMEGTAEAGEILVSPEVRAALPPDFVGSQKGEGWLLRKVRISHPPAPKRPPAPGIELAELVPRALRENLATGIVESEHRIASIGFIKFKGIDSMLAQQGPERVAAELEHLVNTVQRAADAENVTFLASDLDADGGKIILVTGVPVSQHDDEGRLLRAARQIIQTDLDLTLRIGVNRGHVFSGSVGAPFRRTYTIMGDSVNLAARLMAAAGPKMIYGTPAVLDRSSTLFRAEPLEPFRVKGKEQPVSAYAVEEEVGVRPPELKHELPFHGRDGEMQMLVSIVTTCAAVGRGGMMTITGDIGVGKSRLIAEVLERCPGLATLTIQAEPNGRDNAYWALRDPLRRMIGIERGSQLEMAERLRSRITELAADLEDVLPLLGDATHIEVAETETSAAIDPRFRPDRTADAVIELVERVYQGPFAAIAEDGQWLDEASLGLLTRIGTAAESKPWTVIVTAHRERGGFEPLGQEIALPPLDAPAIRQIAIQATSAAPLRPHELDNVVARADGNPLFLAEMVRMIRDTGSADRLPDSLDEVVSKEIDTLPPLTRQLLRYSSVLGRSFRRPVLDEFLAPDGVHLDEATMEELSRFIETNDNERMQFRHVVVHDVAYEGLSYRRRRELHARAGNVIERMAGDDTDAVAEYLAAHYSLSGSHEKVWHYARVAADRAKKAYAPTEAVSQLRKAIEAASHLDDIDSTEVAQLWTQLGEMKDLAGQYEDARDAYSQALRIDTMAPHKTADLHIKRAESWMGSGNLAQAKRNITLGRRQVIHSIDAEGRRSLAKLTAYEASVYAASGDPEKALKVAKSAVELATSFNQREALARAFGVLDWANFMLEKDEPRRGREAIEIYQDLGFVGRSVGIMNNMGAFRYLEGKWAEAVDWYQESLQTAQRSGDIFQAALTRINIAEILISQRRFEDSRPFLDEARRVYVASRSTHYLPLIDLQQARAEMGQGRPEEAIIILEKSLQTQTESAGDTAWKDESIVTLAEAQSMAHRPEKALKLLEEFERDALRQAQAFSARVLRVKASALEGMGDSAAARETLVKGLEIATADENLYDAALLLEALLASRRSAGEEVSRADLGELRDQFELLGISAAVRDQATVT